MKYTFLIYFVVFISSCKKDSQNESFYERAVGIWVPYKAVYSDGRIDSIAANFFLSKFFGAYHESVQLAKDKTFIPVQWQDREHFVLSPDQQGVYNYSENTKLIRFDGVFHDEYEIIHFDKTEMWLKNPYATYYFRKQL